MHKKLKRFEDTLNPMLFKKVARIDEVLCYETLDRLYDIPDESLMNPVKTGHVWGAEESFCWFKTSFVVPDELDVCRRAQNSTHLNKPKHTGQREYRLATAFEALVGMLEWIGDSERLEYLLEIAHTEIKENDTEN